MLSAAIIVSYVTLCVLRIRFAFVCVAVRGSLTAKCIVWRLAGQTMMERQDAAKLTINIKFNWLHGQSECADILSAELRRHTHTWNGNSFRRSSKLIGWTLSVRRAAVAEKMVKSFSGDLRDAVSAFDVRSINTLADQFHLDKSICARAERERGREWEAASI